MLLLPRDPLTRRLEILCDMAKGPSGVLGLGISLSPYSCSLFFVRYSVDYEVLWQSKPD